MTRRTPRGHLRHALLLTLAWWIGIALCMAAVLALQVATATPAHPTATPDTTTVTEAEPTDTMHPGDWAMVALIGGLVWIITAGVHHASKTQPRAYR